MSSRLNEERKWFEYSHDGGQVTLRISDLGSPTYEALKAFPEDEEEDIITIEGPTSKILEQLARLPAEDEAFVELKEAIERETGWTYTGN